MYRGPKKGVCSPCSGKLRALLFQNNFGFFGSLLLFATIASNITEWAFGRRERAKLPQGTLSSRVGVSVRSTSDQRMLNGERSAFCVQRMLRHANHLRLAGKDAAGSLAECHACH